MTYIERKRLHLIQKNKLNIIIQIYAIHFNFQNLKF